MPTGRHNAGRIKTATRANCAGSNTSSDQPLNLYAVAPWLSVGCFPDLIVVVGSYKADISNLGVSGYRQSFARVELNN
jgi:hypothetical protein